MAVAVYKSLISGAESAYVRDMSASAAPAAPAAQEATQPVSDSFVRGSSGNGLAGLLGGHGRRVAPQASIQAPGVFRKA